MKDTFKIIRIVFLLLIYTVGKSQSYHAFNGSTFAGGLGNFTNPASAINSTFKWDFSLLGVQTNTSNNAVRISNFSFDNLTPDNIGNILIQPNSGDGARSFINTSDLHLFNIRYNIDEKQSVSFGLRFRSNSYMEASPFHYTDSISGFNEFVHYNNSKGNVTPFHFHGYNVSWMENDFSYARILVDDDEHRISGGITVALLRGLSGLYGGIDNLNYLQGTSKNTITSGEATILYSANTAKLDSRNTGYRNLKDLIKASKTSIGASIGFEYVVKEQIFEEKYNPKNYSWKFGVSVMDIGSNKFDTDTSSVLVKTPDAGLTDTSLERQIKIDRNNSNLKQVLIDNFEARRVYDKTFKMRLPTRLVISIDKKLDDNFFINGLFNLNFYANDVSNIYDIKTSEINRIIITPRWETPAFGFYMPIQFTEKKDLMIGLAAKLGPLVVGIHNLNWLQKTKLEELDGGGYLALHFQPFSFKKQHHSLDCYTN